MTEAHADDVKQALHETAQALRQSIDGRYRQSVSLHPGILTAADDIDPYVLIESFDPAYDEEHPAGPRARADCRMCRSGEGHWHDKFSNLPV